MTTKSKNTGLQSSLSKENNLRACDAQTARPGFGPRDMQRPQQWQQTVPVCLSALLLSLGLHDSLASHRLSNPREKRHLLYLASSSSSALSLFFLVQVTCLSLKQSLQPKGWKYCKGLGSVPPGSTGTEGEARVVAHHGAGQMLGRQNSYHP